MYLSVIIPAYNEEKRIVKTLLDVNAYLKRQSYDYEIIVISDGSKDNTVNVVKGLQSRVSHLQIIANEVNRGKGYVVKQGLLKAIGEYRLFMDADNATSIDQIEVLMPHIATNDIVIGSRSLRDSKIIKPQPWYRIVLGKLYRFLVRVVIGQSNLKDTQCGFKLFSAKSARNILPQCKINGWSFDVEILMVARHVGYSIKEVPVLWIDDRDSKISFDRMAQALFELVKIRWGFMVGSYRLPDQH